MSSAHPSPDYAAAYALGSLDAQEKTAFEMHLSHCPACQEDVFAYQEAAGLLAFAAPPAHPPAALRNRVLTEARKVRPGGPLSVSPEPPARTPQTRGPLMVPREEAEEAEEAEAPPRSGRPGWPLMVPREAPDRRAWAPWLLAAASVVFALAMGAFYLAERARGDSAEALAQTAAIEASELRSRLATRDSILAVLTAVDLQTASLAATGKPPSARVYYDAGRNRIVLTTFDLPRAPDGRTYQLWGLAAGVPTSLGVFNTEADGRAVVALTAPAGAAFELSAVTEEPAGGSPLPTTTPILVGSMTAR